MKILYWLVLLFVLPFGVKGQDSPLRLEEMSYEEATNEGVKYFFEKKEAQKAIKYWQHARNISNKKSEEYLIVTQILGMCYFELEQYSKALLLYEEISPYLIIYGDRVDYHTLDQQRQIYVKQKKEKEEKRIAMQMYSLISRTSNAAKAKWAFFNGGILKCQKNSQYTKAIFYAELAHKIVQKELSTFFSPYITSLNNLASAYRDVGRYLEAEQFYETAINAFNGTEKKRDSTYFICLSNLGLLYNTMGQYEKAEQLLTKVLKLRSKYLGKTHESYISSLNNLAVMYQARGDYVLAEHFFLEALEKKEKKLGKEHESYWTSLINLAALYGEIEAYDKAKECYSSIATIMERTTMNFSLYSTYLNNHAELYTSCGQYLKAQHLHEKNLLLVQNLFGEDHPECALVLSNIASLYHYQGLYEAADSLMRKVLVIDKTHFGKFHPRNATNLSNLAALYQRIGKYDKAEAFFNESLEIQKQTLGNAHPSYCSSLNNLAGLYFEMGRYAKARDLFLASVDIAKKTLGEKHSNYALGLNNLGEAYGALGNDTKAEQLFIKSLSIYEEKKLKKHSSYAVGLSNLAALYLKHRHYTKAEFFLKKAILIKQESIGRDHPDYAMALSNLAKCYRDQNHFFKAEKLYEEAIEIIKKSLGKTHSAYGICLSNWSLLLLANNRYSKGEQLLVEAFNIYLKNLINAYTSLGEHQQYQLYNKTNGYYQTLYSFAFNTKTHDSLILHAQNASLAIKGLSLQSTQGIRQIVKQSTDETLKNLYQQWRGMKQQIATAYVLSIPERKKRGIDLQVWKETANELERKLASRSKPLAQKLNIQNKLVHFRDIKQKLHSKSAAIDFVHFQYRGDTSWTDSILYYAMITRHNSQYPVCVRIGTEKELLPFFSKEIKEEGDNYIHNDRTNQALYQLIWAPLLPHLSGVEDIHLSPDGLLNQLSFEALLSASEPQERLMNKYQLHYYSTLKNFVLPRIVSGAKTSNQVLLLGGANYGIETGSNNEKSFNYLKGTKEEVAILAEAFTAAKWKVDLLTGEKALEQNVKEVEGLASPRVVHLATHGYFYPPPNDYRKQMDVWISDKNAYQYRIQQHEHPLYRSGLALTGANKTWTGRPVGILDANDGILTAYEVAMLNLYGTELVVLSACETGLGENSTTEGVYGLQRAFKQAGVDKLIVSLWKVPDGPTKEFMRFFYKNYLSGMSVHEALERTKITMQTIDPNPYYWAAFILIE